MYANYVSPKARIVRIGFALVWLSFIDLILFKVAADPVFTEFLIWRRFAPSQCVIESSEVVRTTDKETPYSANAVFSGKFQGRAFASRRVCAVEYNCQFTSYDAAQDVVSRFVRGAQVPCLLDPQRLDRSVLLHDPSSVIFPIVFGLVMNSFGFYMLADAFKSGGMRTNRMRLRGMTIGVSAETLANEPLTPMTVGVASVVGFLFFGTFFVVGLWGYVSIYKRPSDRYEQAKSWETVPCRIIQSNVREQRGSRNDPRTYYFPDILFEYQYAGVTHKSSRRTITGDYINSFANGPEQGRQASAERYLLQMPVGTTRNCIVDPKEPNRAALELGPPPSKIALFILAFIAVGAGGIVAIIYGLICWWANRAKELRGSERSSRSME